MITIATDEITVHITTTIFALKLLLLDFTVFWRERFPVDMFLR